MTIRRRGVVLLVQLAAIAFVGLFGTVIPQFHSGVRIAAQLFVIPLVIVALIRAHRRPATPLDLPIMLGLFASLLVGVASADPTASIQGLGLVAAWALLFVVSVDIARREWLRSRIALAVAGIVATWLVILAVIWVGEKVTWVQLGGGMPNLFEATQSMIWLTVNVAPLLALLGAGFVAYVEPQAVQRVVALVLLAASVLAVPMSGGRAAWVGMAAALLLLLLLGGGWKRALSGSDRRLGRVGLIGVPLLGVIGAVFFGERIFSMSGLSARWPLWEQAFRIAAADPMTGGGPGTFAWLRLGHADDYASRVPAILAHNVPIQTLADGGLVLLLVLGLLTLTFVVMMWRARRQLSTAGRVGIACVVGFGVTSLLDDHSSLPAVIAMVVVLGGWITAEVSPHVPSTRAPGWALPAVAATALLISIPFVVRVDLARLEGDAGRAAAEGGAPETAAQHFERASELHPENALYRLEAGITSYLAGDGPAAHEHFERAVSLSPGDPRPLGALADLADDQRERIALLDGASRLTGDDPRYAYRLGLALLREHRASAIDALALSVVIEPTVLTALERDAGQGVADAVIARARERAPKLASRLRISVERLSDDLALGTGTTPAAPAHLAVARSLNGEPDDAWHLLARAIRDHPYETTTWDAGAYLAHRECDAEAYRRYSLLRFWSPGGARTSRSPDVIQPAFDLPYREVGLGRYQPGGAERGEILLGWPAGLVGPPGECAGWDVGTLEDPFR